MPASNRLEQIAKPCPNHVVVCTQDTGENDATTTTTSIKKRSIIPYGIYYSCICYQTLVVLLSCKESTTVCLMGYANYWCSTVNALSVGFWAGARGAGAGCSGER